MFVRYALSRTARGHTADQPVTAPPSANELPELLPAELPQHHRRQPEPLGLLRGSKR